MGVSFNAAKHMFSTNIFSSYESCCLDVDAGFPPGYVVRFAGASSFVEDVVIAIYVLGFPPQVSSLSSVTYVACICTAQAQVLGGV